MTDPNHPRYLAARAPASKIRRGDNTRRRLRLWIENPFCHWCQRKTELLFPAPGQKTRWNCATVDHIKTREEAATQEEYRARSNMVLACHSCNQRRNNLDQDKKAAAIARATAEYRKHNPVLGFTPEPETGRGTA